MDIMKEFKCTKIDHCELQIQGTCENFNCQQEYRRVCLKCIPIHRQNDKEFKESDIKTSEDLKEIMTCYINDNKQMINNIYLQCNIQNVILLTEIIEFMKIWSARQQQLMIIQDDLEQFEKQYWDKFNVNDYLHDQNSKQGIYNYMQHIQDQLINIENMMDSYIRNQELTKNEQYENNKQFLKEDRIQNLFKDSQQLLNAIKENTFSKIIKNQLFQQKQRNDSPQVTFFEILMKQGYNLNSNVPKNQFLQIKGQYIDAIKDYQDAYLQAFAQVYSIDSKKYLDESLNLINKSIKLNDKYSKSQYLKGIILFDKQQYVESVKTFNQCIKLDPNNIDAFNALGNCYRNLQKQQDALINYDKALLIDSRFVKSYIGKANILHEQGKFLEAIDLYDQAIKLDQKNLIAYYGKAISQHNIQKYQESIDTCNSAIYINSIEKNCKANSQIQQPQQQSQILNDQGNKQKQNSQIIKIIFQKGQSLLYLQNYVEAIKMFNEIIKADPNNLAAYDEKGRSLYKQQNFQEALSVYDQIIKLDPRNLNGHLAKGELLLVQMKKPQEAKKVFEQCLKLDPNNQIAISRLQQI